MRFQQLVLASLVAHAAALRKLQAGPELTSLGNNPSESYPLGECQGDCDNDTHCAYGLICEQRDGLTPVTGCNGEGTSGHDYCVVPTAPNQLVLMGDEEEPSSAFPLGECQGDCDNDAECAFGLKCSDREGIEELPGCVGAGVKWRDYCYKPTDPMELVLMANADSPVNYPLGECQGECTKDSDCADGLLCYIRVGTEEVPGCSGTGMNRKSYCFAPSGGELLLRNKSEPDVLPLGECEGDCNSDRDCEHGLVCFQRNGTVPVPGCAGTGGASRDYCIVPTEPNTLVLMGDNNVPEENFPLQECQGDCDNDLQCDVGLTCFHRDSTEAVPGCVGAGQSANDYCAVPDPGTLVVMGREGIPAESYPFGECEGICNSDDDCAGDLVCFRRKGSEEVPGCSGPGVNKMSYCFAPTGADLMYIGDNGVPQDMYPLGVCEGDCDKDSHCDFGLVCFQRNGTATVPGCTGEGGSGLDYCITPTEPNTLVLMGDDNEPVENFPLGACQGDCDNDSECQFGLKCVQRSKLEEVEGCVGDGQNGMDYCSLPSDPKELVLSGGIEGRADDTYPFAECRGDCRSDADCAEGLMCFLRTGTEPVPGCTGVGQRGLGYCFVPFPTALVRRSAEDAPILKECQGDCDRDSDCDVGLRCRQRSALEDVPGCEGPGASGTDYCYRPVSCLGGQINVEVNGCSFDLLVETIEEMLPTECLHDAETELMILTAEFDAGVLEETISASCESQMSTLYEQNFLQFDAIASDEQNAVFTKAFYDGGCTYPCQCRFLLRTDLTPSQPTGMICAAPILLPWLIHSRM